MSAGVQPVSRIVSWTALTLGVGASVAANVAHAHPAIGPRLSSAFAPIALLLTIEVMARVPWPRSLWWSLIRWLGAGTVAAVAGIVSYSHMRGLLLSYGEDPLTATVQPLSVDGLLIVSAMALLAMGARSRDTRPVAEEDTADASPDTRTRAASVLSLRPDIPVAELAIEVGVSERHARRIKAEITS